ncbi:hypothetical protein K501DRAFT_259456 [Backusella circina FSU 941]|nr:hypothetical protein K501DRAFT_259456 [Backusella circina FSU 941]
MSDLIESVFHDIVIPPILFSIQHMNNKQVRVCIDGKQRLTTIYRFMKNEIPYLDRSGGIIVKKYYSETLDQGNANIMSVINQTQRRYLTKEEFTKFGKFEIMCTDYKNLSEDEEYEMFLRVNQGQAFSTDEKLRAHNTPLAKLVRKLTDDYSEISSILLNPSPAHRFRFIAEILCHLRNGATQFNHSAAEIERFIVEKDEYPTILLDHAKKALSVWITKMSDDTFVRVLNMHPFNNSKCHATRIELLVFSYYLCLGVNNSDMEKLADDFRHLRTRIRESSTGRADMSRTNWRTGMEWCQEMVQENERIRQLGLQQQQSRHASGPNNIYDESEIDELKSEGEESESDEAPPTVQIRKRDNGRSTHQGTGHSTRKPTARRGKGRAPRPE